jgi:hypothetical protein
MPNPLAALKAHFERPPTILDAELDVPNDVLPFYLEGYADCHEATKALVDAAVKYAEGYAEVLQEIDSHWRRNDPKGAMSHHKDQIRALLEKGDE